MSLYVFSCKQNKNSKLYIFYKVQNSYIFDLLHVSIVVEKRKISNQNSNLLIMKIELFICKINSEFMYFLLLPKKGGRMEVTQFQVLSVNLTKVDFKYS